MNTLFETRSGRRTGKHMQRDCEMIDTGTRSVQCGVRAALLGAAFACAFSMNARGQDYGLDFVTVGAAGNRAPIASETPWNTAFNRGAVNYEFRITRTEIVTEQWLEFVHAYEPYWQGQHNWPGLTGTYIYDSGSGYELDPGTQRFPIDPSWENAARYCNWLHNGKVNAAWAFENGAYDTNTFIINPDGSSNHQVTHNLGARFWIPTYDETIKAFYYDPDRYGAGQDGYWTYPNQSLTRPVSGLPQNGGTTNAGLGWNFFNTGGYPEQTSPWGLLDTSGGANEMTETSNGDPFRYRYVIGTHARSGGSSIIFFDRIEGQFSQLGGHDLRNGGFEGFRVAAAIPASPAVSLLCLGCMTMLKRRKR